MNWIVLLALIPLAWRIGSHILPVEWTEPYAYWDSSRLNTPGKDGRLPTWRNVGYWETGKETFSEANEALARRLLAFAAPSRTDHVLDIAHGSGDSLLIHLESHPKTLTGITSLSSEMEAAQSLVADYMLEHGGIKTKLNWYTGSGNWAPRGGDPKHPLNPMRGFLGDSDYGEIGEQVILSDDAELEGHSTGPEPYDLVYILDAIYHFQPGVINVVDKVLPTLRQGSGVLAYTDIITPPGLGTFPGNLLAAALGTFLHVPWRNLNNPPRSLEDYADTLRRAGYDDVRIEDWSEHVFAGLAEKLGSTRGFSPAAYLATKAKEYGWKYVAVRGVRKSASVE